MSGGNGQGVMLDEMKVDRLRTLLNESMDLSGAIPVLLQSDYDGAIPAVDALQLAIYERLDKARNLICTGQEG
jgi:hypothetical protein